ncbi:MAG TPA: hypothetical protein VK174_00990, partial [Chitinophagales bacterium]|nr:hypothetical protein [Chitinophagales bacterium]
MKPLITAIVFHFAFFVTLHTYAQPGTWTWVKGDSVQSVGRFGIKGVPDPANEPPSRYACAFWTDTANNFWVFGGVNDWYSTGWLLNDLWKFDPVTQNWTWMQGDVYQDSLYYPVYAAPKGVFSPLNKPGGDGFGIFTWVTPDNHLWMYGGYRSHMFGCRLWQYDPAINQWAWMTDSTGYAANHGTLGVPSPTNSPGQRYENNTCWVDSAGDLWMYGGAYIFSINMNLYKDMWKYTRSTGLWTWMSGSNVSNSLPGSLGTIGVPSVNNYPPGRMSNFFWKENNGNFRMSGGGRSSTSVGGVSSFRQDDWRFNPTTLEWTRLNGAGTFDNSPEAWVNHCDTSEENQEGATYENRAVWKICDDIVMNYNGGIDSFSNSLWAYVTTTHQWIKISEALYPGRRGTKGVASPLNFPTHRLGPASFKDKQGNLWLFGGWSPIFVTTPYFNDMWKYEVDSSCFRNFGCLSP